MITGLLNNRITIEKELDGTTSVLSPEPIYEDYMITWANVYVRSGQTKYDESKELWFTTEFTIRYNTKSKAITNKFRIKYNNQYYSILEIIETEPKQSIKIIGEHWYGE
jgi:SPP1 family predicted phage head-tail adaptor